jgi:nitrate/TMAO reductase-like tetraheme cytochrome c subunit
MKNLYKLSTLFFAAAMILWACEGPMGPAGADGKDGADGQDGADANETCKLCHNNTVVDAKAIEYEYSVHFTGLAYEEGTRNNCAPCHSHQGFLEVVKNNTPATITQNPTDPTKYINNYIVSASTTALPGPISCFTCHSSLHKNYAATDFFPLATTAAVPMTMWGGTKTINFKVTTGNLCAKCHQPRPVTASSGAMIDYTKLVSEPTTAYNLSSVSYRTGIHYGAQAAMASGKGGIEFGTGYENADHVEEASCTDCHMATPSGLSGGHSFSVAGNFNGCNTTGCHSNMSSTSTILTAVKTDISAKIDELAAKINAIGAGHDILQKDPADGIYHGYIDIYDAGSNPTGYWKNPANGNPAFPALTNAQLGAILNFQLVVRDGSMGVHNYSYIKKLLENTIAAI